MENLFGGTAQRPKENKREKGREGNGGLEEGVLEGGQKR